MSTIYGAYLHCRPDGTPFYVGKGTVTRMNRMCTRNPYHTNITDKHGRGNILKGFMECSTEQIAFDLEMGIIKCLKRMGVRLANMSDGGEGPSGITAWNKGLKGVMPTPWNKGGAEYSDAIRKKMSDSRKGRSYQDIFGDKADEILEKRRTAMLGNNNPNANRDYTEADRKKMGDVNRGKCWYNNGELSKMFIKGTEPEGFIKGRGKVVWQS